MSDAARPAGTPRFRRHDIDWGPVAGRVVWVPAAYRCGTLDEDTVARILRCTPGSLAALRDLGLTPEETPDGPRYDIRNVRNAALYSLSGRTEVEAAMRPALSFLRGSDRNLFGERHWGYEMSPVGAAAGPVPAAAGSYLVHPLTPEVSGGRTEALTVGGTAPDRAGDRVVVPAGAILRGSIVTRGHPARFRNPRIRSIAEEFLSSGVRWHSLPEELKRDADAAFAAGIGNCDTLSTILGRRLMAAGFPSRIYRGWIVGLTETPHSWLEVTDDDGGVKVIDSALLLLNAYTSLGAPGFAARAFGARLSRVVPTRCPLDEPICVAATPQGPVPGEVRFACRPRRGGITAREAADPSSARPRSSA